MMVASSVVIRALELGDAAACDAVLASLPYFFGDPEGQRQCHEAVRTQRGFVGEIDGAVRGFITLKSQQPGSSEITWLAVEAEHRRGGIGRKLVEASMQLLRDEGQSMLFVLTLGPSVPEEAEDNYEGTREFYRRIGFVGLREFGLRDWNDAYALVLARAL
jgi:ribosomal protein S18 acetylase RimI-like enzyme